MYAVLPYFHIANYSDYIARVYYETTCENDIMIPECKKIRSFLVEVTIPLH